MKSCYRSSFRQFQHLVHTPARTCWLEAAVTTLASSAGLLAVWSWGLLQHAELDSMKLWKQSSRRRLVC